MLNNFLNTIRGIFGKKELGHMWGMTQREPTYICMRRSERFFRVELGHENKVNVILLLLFIFQSLFIEKVA